MVAAALLTAATTGAVPPVQRPTFVRRTGAFRTAPMLESSGVTPSHTHPGQFWTINDSGNDPSVFLADTTGAVIGFVNLPVPNVDWEALTSGPCGDGRWCLYIGDIGDNRAVRPAVRVYRIPEPTDQDLVHHRGAAVTALTVQYADGPRDAEGLVATSAGDLAIVSKGRQGRVAAYWIGRDAWRGSATIARPFWNLPIATSLLLASLVTDAALSPDQTRLAVRTYREVYIFKRSSPASRLPEQLAAICDVAGLEPLGEGITWWRNGSLLMTSEMSGKQAGPITVLGCDAP